MQAVVLEGKYWKRRPDAVASEYRKWRYYREKKVSLVGKSTSTSCASFLVMAVTSFEVVVFICPLSK